jgi:uncharacterized membrane protein YphA (DoxX/SURF4 family)
MGKLFMVGGNFLFGWPASMWGEKKQAYDVWETLLAALGMTPATVLGMSSELVLSAEETVKPVE